MANEKNISLDNLKTFKKKADATYAKKTDITASGLYVGKASEKSNSATTNGNTYLKLFDNDIKRSQHLINGEGATIVTSDASGTIKIATPIKNLDTTSGSGLGNGRSENIVGSGTIYLHKVAKTGSYNDLVNKPTIPTNVVTIDTEQRISGKKYFENDVNFGKWINPVRQVSDAPAKLNLISSAQTSAGFFDTVMFAGAGDWLYLGHLKPTFSIKASFKGNGEESDTYSASLGYTRGWLDYLTDWDYQNGWLVRPTKVSATTPAIIQIKFTNMLYTDVLRLILTGHNLNDSSGNYSGFLDDYTIEVCTDYAKDTWTTVVNRTNANDNIGKGLIYAMQTGSYTTCYGIRLKITKCHVNGNGFAYIKITSMQLRDYRPGFKFPDCLGAISQGGGDVWGQLNTKNVLQTRTILPEDGYSYNIGTSAKPYFSVYANDFYENGTALSDKYLAKSDTTYAKKTDIAGAVGGWTLMRSIGTKVYSYLPTNIKPSTSTHAASGAPASAGKCLVDVSFFKKQGSLDGTTYPFFKTVIDVTYQGPLFELTPFAVRIGAIPYAYKWYMPRITVSRGSMNSAWFNYMMKSLAGQADGNLVGITFEDVTVARQLLSGNLGGNGIVAPQGGLNEDGFNLFTILMELDTANDGNLAVTGCHYRIVLTHPDNVLMPDE